MAKLVSGQVTRTIGSIILCFLLNHPHGGLISTSTWHCARSPFCPWPPLAVHLKRGDSGTYWVWFHTTSSTTQQKRIGSSAYLGNPLHCNLDICFSCQRIFFLHFPPPPWSPSLTFGFPHHMLLSMVPNVTISPIHNGLDCTPTPPEVSVKIHHYI